MLSVVVATFNGGRKLKKTLDCFCSQKFELDWQLIVVDNNSSDDTYELIQSYQHKLPLTLVFEERRGKNYALNTAIKYVEYETILFTDDDVEFDLNFLKNAYKTSVENENYEIIGGLIEPNWEIVPPCWIIDWAPLGVLYALNNNQQEGECPPGKVWGPNMIVRTTVFKEKNLFFNEKIGPNGTDFYPMGSETEFTKRAFSNGCKCYFSKSFFVHHWIPKESLSEQWIFKRASRLGRGVTLAKIQKLNKFNLIEYQILAKFYYILSYFYIHRKTKRTFWWKYKAEYYRGCKEAYLSRFNLG